LSESKRRFLRARRNKAKRKAKERAERRDKRVWK